MIQWVFVGLTWRSGSIIDPTWQVSRSMVKPHWTDLIAISLGLALENSRSAQPYVSIISGTRLYVSVILITRPYISVILVTRLLDSLVLATRQLADYLATRLPLSQLLDHACNQLSHSVSASTNSANHSLSRPRLARPLSPALGLDQFGHSITFSASIGSASMSLITLFNSD